MGFKYFLCYQRYSLIDTFVGERHILLIYKMNLDGVHVGRIILVLGGFLL
jgi:hypothetical protein